MELIPVLEKWIEVLKIYEKMTIQKKNNQNIYKPLIKIFDANDTYKPGFRFQYFDFVRTCILNKKKIWTFYFTWRFSADL